METNGRGRVSQLVFADDREIIVFVRLSVDGRGRKIPITRIFDVVGIRWTVYASSDDRNKRVKNKFFQNLQKKKKKPSTLPASRTTAQSEVQFVFGFDWVYGFGPIARQTNPIIGDARKICDLVRFICEKKIFI